MKEKIKIILLSLIVLLAVLLRFVNLQGNPPALTWDEVAWGYNSYTLGIDGKDEFGRFLPFDYLESFGDFKPPVYAYLGILPVKLFGLNEFSTRFPSAFLGTLTVFITYLLVKEIFHHKKQTAKEIYRNELIALLAAFILAISPWHMLLSRAAFEANVATFFIVTGVWLFLYGLRKNPWLLIISAASFVLSMYTFNTARIVAPLLGIGLVIGLHKELLHYKKQSLIAAVVGLAILLPLIPFLLSPQARLRFNEVNIFSDITVIERTNQQIANDKNTWWSNVIHNRRVAYSIEFARHYLENLTPNFLFVKGDGNPKFSVQTFGQMYFWEIPFLIIGTFLLFRKKQGAWWIIPLWLLISIIPAATARETPHALRIEATLPTFQILAAYGIIWLFQWLPKYKKAAAGVFGVVIFIHLLAFLHTYYRHYPVEYSGEWQYGYKQAITYVQSVEKEYDRIAMTTDLGRPHAYYLFYLKTPPEEFRKTVDVKRDAFGFVNIDGYGKYVFIPNVSQFTDGKHILYVDHYKKMPAHATLKKTISLLDGTPVLAIYTR